MNVLLGFLDEHEKKGHNFNPFFPSLGAVVGGILSLPQYGNVKKEFKENPNSTLAKILFGIGAGALAGHGVSDVGERVFLKNRKISV